MKMNLLSSLNRALHTRNKAERRGTAAVAAAVEALENRTMLSASLLGDAFSVVRGNFNDTGLSMNGAVIGNKPYEPRLDLTDGGVNEARSAFTLSKYNVSAFATDFAFQLSNPTDGGITFTVQGTSPAAVGTAGGGLGASGIAASLAVEFTADSTGSHATLAVNGAAGAQTDLAAAGINLKSGHVFNVEVQYDGGTLSVTETDDSTPNTLTPATATQVYNNVNLAGVVGGSAAYVGFTAGTGAGVVPGGGSAPASSTDEVLDWEFANVPATDGDVGAARRRRRVDLRQRGDVHGQGRRHGHRRGRRPVPLRVGRAHRRRHGGRAAGVADRDFRLRRRRADAPRRRRFQRPVRLRRAVARRRPHVRVPVGRRRGRGREHPPRRHTARLREAGPQRPHRQRVRLGHRRAGLVDAGRHRRLPDVLDRAGGPGRDGGAAPAVVNTATFSDVSVTRTSPVGVDTGAAGVRWSEQSQMWVDLIKQASQFVSPVDGVTPVSVDANGFPTVDFKANVLQTSPNNLGTYSVSMVCNQNPTIDFSSGVVTNQAYDAATKTVTCDVTFSTPNRPVGMSVTNTGGGATAIHVIRPGYDPVNPPVFTNNYLNELRDLHPTALRFMNYLSTNNNPVGQWSQRSMPTDATQTATLQSVDYFGRPEHQFGLQTKGLAWEYAVMLANAVHSDMWINIPAHADDNYLTQLANLIKHGDTVGGVSYPALAPDLNVYIEFSNETWNPGYEGYFYDLEAAQTEVIAGTQPNAKPSNLNYDNLPTTQAPDGSYASGMTWGERWFARRLLQTGQVFASAFGAGSLTTRVRPVLSIINTGEEQDLLNFVSANYGSPSNYFYGVGSVVYMNQNGPSNQPNTVNGGFNNPNLTPTQALQNLAANATDPAGYYDALGAIAKPLGLRVLAYEGGIDMSGPEDVAPAWRPPATPGPRGRSSRTSSTGSPTAATRSCSSPPRPARSATSTATSR